MSESGEEYCVKRRKKGTQEETLHSSRLSKKEALRIAHTLNSGLHGKHFVYSVEKGKIYDFIDSTNISTEMVKTGAFPWVPANTQGFDW